MKEFLGLGEEGGGHGEEKVMRRNEKGVKMAICHFPGLNPQSVGYSVIPSLSPFFPPSSPHIMDFCPVTLAAAAGYRNIIFYENFDSEVFVRLRGIAVNRSQIKWQS